jgi:hypothetical protein
MAGSRGRNDAFSPSLKNVDKRNPFLVYHEKRMKTYGRHGRYRTVDLYRVEVALYHLSYVPTKNPFIDNKLYLVCQGGKALEPRVSRERKRGVPGIVQDKRV